MRAEGDKPHMFIVRLGMAPFRQGYLDHSKKAWIHHECCKYWKRQAAHPSGRSHWEQCPTYKDARAYASRQKRKPVDCKVCKPRPGGCHHCLG